MEKIILLHMRIYPDFFFFPAKLWEIADQAEPPIVAALKTFLEP